MNGLTDIDYYSSKSISQSKIKLFLDSREEYYYREILNNRNNDTEALGFGRYYHTLILQPELIKDKYIIDTGLKVDGMMGIFIEELAKNNSQENAYVKAGFKWSLDKVVEKFNEEVNQKYYKFLLETKGKELITIEDNNKGQFMLKNFNNSIFSRIVNPIEPSDIHTELIIEWFVPYVKLSLKSMLDRVIINHNKKTITIIDLKTTKQSTTRKFVSDARYYKYYIQAAFYISAVEYKLSTDWVDYKDYNIDFLFLPQCTKEPYHILTPIRLSKEDIDKGYMEYRKALIDLEECLTLNIWESDKDLVNFEGIAEVQLFT